MELVISIIFGLIIGSFLNVCVYRVPRKLSIVSPARSYCPKCGFKIPWWQNIPVLSWLLLNGKCSNCNASISIQYLTVEVMSGVFAALSVLHFGTTMTAVAVYALSATLITISFIDLEHKIIPDRISLPGITLGLLLSIVNQYTSLFSFPIATDCLDSLLGMIAGGGFFLLVSYGYYFATKQVGLGGGDIKLLAMTGAILGVESVLPTIFMGSIVGAVIGLIVVAIQGGDRKTEIPFGPWLSLGAILYIFTEIDIFRF